MEFVVQRSALYRERRCIMNLQLASKLHPTVVHTMYLPERFGGEKNLVFATEETNAHGNNEH